MQAHEYYGKEVVAINLKANKDTISFSATRATTEWRAGIVPAPGCAVVLNHSSVDTRSLFEIAGKARASAFNGVVSAWTYCLRENMETALAAVREAALEAADKEESEILARAREMGEARNRVEVAVPTFPEGGL